MSAEAAFIEDIVADPDDDGVRLIYADWLEDAGRTPRARFIRLQIEGSRLPEGDPRRDDLFEQAEALRDPAWDAGMAAAADGVRYRRGFVEYVSFTDASRLPALLEHWRSAPIVELDLTGDAFDLAFFLASEFPARLRRLWLRSTGLDAGDFIAMCNEPRLAGLHGLHLPSNNLGDEGAVALAACPHFAGLEELTLNYNRVFADGAAALGSSPYLRRLTTFLAHFNEFRNDGAARLFAGEFAAHLTRLDVGFNEIGDDGAASLARSQTGGLRQLILSHAELTDAGVVALAGRPQHFARLERLELQYNKIGNPGLDALLDAGALRTVSYLDLSKNRIGGRSVARLARSGDVPALAHLDLETNPVTDVGGRALIESPLCNRLSRLTLTPEHLSESVREALKGRYGDRLTWYHRSSTP